MESEKRDSVSEIKSRFTALQSRLKDISIQSMYRSESQASVDKDKYNSLEKDTKITGKMVELLKEYSKNCEVDIFSEPPCENCSLLGYEKQYVKIELKVFKIKKSKILASVDVKGYVSSDGSISTQEHGNYIEVYNLVPKKKVIRQAFYVRKRKKLDKETAKLKLDDETIRYIDVKHFNKATEETAGYKLFKVSSWINKISLCVGLLCLFAMFIGNNYIIGQVLLKSKSPNISKTFLNIFNVPFEITSLACLGVYLISAIMKICTIKHYNNSLSVTDFNKIINKYNYISDIAFVVLTFAITIFINAINLTFAKALYEPYNKYNSIFENFPLVSQFAELCKINDSFSFKFSSYGDGAIFLSCLSLSFTGILIPIGIILKEVFLVIDFCSMPSDFFEIDMKIIKRAELAKAEKKTEKIAKKFNEINESLITFTPGTRSKSVYKFIPAVFDNKSELIESKKIRHIKSGKFFASRLLYPILAIMPSTIVFLVYDAFKDLCALGMIGSPGKIFLYALFFGIMAGIIAVTTKNFDTRKELDV